MKTQKYAVNQYLIESVLSKVREGEIAIPEIQRPFVWDASQVRDLLDSLYQGFPVGYLIAVGLLRGALMATHALPDQLTPDSVPFLACLDAIYQDPDTQVTLDCTQVRFVTPFGLCLMAATFDWLEQENKQVGHAGLSPSVGGYLARMDCLTGDLAEPFVGPRNNRADALVEVQVISDRSEADAAAQKLAQAFVGRLPGTDPQAVPDEMTGLKARRGGGAGVHIY